MLRPLETVVHGWTPTPGRAGDPLGTVTLAWRELAGPEIARNARPSAIDGPTLVVTVRSSSWSQQLAFLAEGLAARVAELPGLEKIERIRLRVGRMSDVASVPRTEEKIRRVRAEEPTYEPLPADAEPSAALARLRERIRGVRAGAAFGCALCGTPLALPGTCAPCANARRSGRAASVERALFERPWLAAEGLETVLPGISAEEVNAARERLLLRWWGSLTRARREHRLGPRERAIAVSYVLLHSGLPPHAVTPAIVRNLLGGELAELLDGTERPAPLAKGRRS